MSLQIAFFCVHNDLIKDAAFLILLILVCITFKVLLVHRSASLL